MSMYVNFFIRRGNDFVPIGEYSRNSIIYQLISGYAEYKKIKSLTIESIQDLITRARNRKEEARKTTEQVKERIKNMRSLAKTWNEALEYLEDYETAILEYEEEIKEARYAQHFFSFLEDIIDTIRYDSKSEYNYNEYIYAGIEIGRPTVEDIVSGCVSNEEECNDIKKKLDVIEASPKRETQDESISKFADGEWWKEV